MNIMHEEHIVDVRKSIEHVLQKERDVLERAGMLIQRSYAEHPIWVRVNETLLQKTLLSLVSEMLRKASSEGVLTIVIVETASEAIISFKIDTDTEGAESAETPVPIRIPLSSPPNTIETSMKIPRSIIVVDDNQAAADILVKLLSLLGYEAHASYSGKDVLRELEVRKPDLMILDIGMPEMDGFELMQELHEREIANIPVIALTGYGLAEDKERARMAGFTKHLTKPVGVRELQAEITNVFSTPRV